MTSVPTHFKDKHHYGQMEKVSVCLVTSVDIIRIIETLCEDKDITSGEVKTESFEIRIRR
jgi:hypothetical protein